MAGVEWKGTPEEYAELLKAIGSHCSCQRTMGALTRKCESHTMLDDQRIVDHLVFGKRAALALVEEEFTSE